MWSAVAGIFGKVITGYQNRKAKESEAKAAWEQAAGRSMDNGWKDEYITVVITLPILQSFVGNLVYAFTGNSSILQAQTQFLTDMGALMATPYGDVMMVVVLAAVGIKGLKALR
jgi:hypothetical protein